MTNNNFQSLRPASRQVDGFYLEVNGERLFCVSEGSGPAIMLVHSLGSSVHMWRKLTNDLRDEYTVVAFDCRGHGLSSNHGGFTVGAVADDLRGVANELGLDTFHLLGISMGGLAATTYYCRYPASVRSLILADSYAHMGSGAEERIATTRETLERTSMADFGEWYAADTLLPNTPVEVRRELAEAIGRMVPENYLDTLSSILTEDVNPLLDEVRVPALVLVGEEDRRAPVPFSKHLADSIPGAQLRSIPAAGHLSNLDQPRAFSGTLKSFLKDQHD